MIAFTSKPAAIPGSHTRQAVYRQGRQHRPQVCLLAEVELGGDRQRRGDSGSEVARPDGGELPDGTTAERRIEWILERLYAHEERINWGDKMQQLPKQWQRDDAKVRRAVEQRLLSLKGEITDARIGLRMAGLLYVIVGIVLGMAVNLT
jgi:hypothetical protein